MALGALLFAGFVSRPVAAATPVASDYAQQIKPLLQSNCFRCHGPKKQKADIDFSPLQDERSILHARKLWKRAAEQLESGDMPPEDATQQPTPEQRRQIVAWMKRVLDGGYDDPNAKDPGPPIVRRLTVNEYNRTLSDLLGIDINANALVGMPDDVQGSGFVNLAATLDVPASLMEKYVAMSEAALSRIFVAADPELAPLAAETEGWRKGNANKALDKVLIARPKPGVSPREAAEKVIVAFGRRAYRRPLSDAETQRFVSLFDSLSADGKAYETAIRMTLQPMLVSPNFIFRIERDHPGAASAEAYRITDHELATRLSYFLWSTMPDDELAKLADEGKLSQPGELDRQVTRLLGDARSKTLTTNFATQWVQLYRLNNARPSTEFFPTYTREIRDAMRDEATTFLDHLRSDDRPLTDLLDSDYTFLNQPLAKFYGLPEVKGKGFVKVHLSPDDHRGGLLGMGAILSATSHTFRTSPTLRGRYVLDVIFGAPPDPPPANVGQIKDEKPRDHEKAINTFREQLSRHATDATCAACHKKLDPMGFALDNYDAIGRWREADGNGVLDTTGKLPTGQSIHGVSELKALILSRQDQFLHSAAERTLMYALGRELDYYDEPAIRQIQADMAADGNKYSSLIKAVVKSYPFQYRRNLFAGEGEASAER